MLTDRYRQPFQVLQASIDRLTQLIGTGELTVAEVEAAQQVFQEQVLPLDLEDLEPTIASRLQAIQTEISKQFRLLSTDVVFLKAARQSATATQRQGQIRERLGLLSGYCGVVLGREGE
ncbi:heterocyst frequency control protein PatD [Leptolyngbya ohadii]|uniref:heterocyst frequency control protein PatD n=1 Tax=Leptolyngbya ohadii TaxID=1962290 RepID=UPI000B59BA14|nr:heterocyst frequency control protein PatD [Leptolyngbya ohadii]